MIGRSALRLAAVGVGALTLSGCALLSVSYTHLTLPTKRIV